MFSYSDFGLPSRVPISPDYERCRDTRLRWLRHHNLLTSADLYERHQKSDYALLAAGVFPTATGDDLDLGTDVMNWFFCVDDLFDTPLGTDMNTAAGLVRTLVDALDHAPPPDAHPVVHAFRDLWAREQVGMSPQWLQRAHANWVNYFLVHVTETRYRVTRTRPTPVQRLSERRQSVGCLTTYDLAERVQHFELPHALYETDNLREAVLHVTDAIIFGQEIVSYAKELAEPENQNYLTALVRHQKLTYEEAWTVARDGVVTNCQQFVAKREHLKETADLIGLSAYEREETERYLDLAIQACLTGCFNWYAASGRYACDEEREPRDAAAVPRRAGYALG